MYLLDTLHSRAGLGLVPYDSGELCCFGRKVGVLVRVGQLRLHQLLGLLPVGAGCPRGPVLRQSLLVQGEGGLGDGRKGRVKRAT